MKKPKINKLLLMIAALVALPASAVFANSEMAQIVTQGGRPVDCLSPIAVNKIDGLQKIVPAQGVQD